MIVSFEAEVFAWRGPAPYLFAALPAELSEELRRGVRELSYGWGCIPARARVGDTEWRTSLMPKEGRYLLPLRMAVQKAEAIGVGKKLKIRLEILA